MALKKNIMSTTNEISKFKLRSTSTSTNSTNNIKQNKRDYLNSKGIVATIRRELGSDIDAACGQLRRAELKRS